MTILEYFKTIDLSEIEKYVSDGQEENISLEFKTVNHPNYNNNNKEFDKRNLSKALSGFANSTGGIIIWGIKAGKSALGPDVAQALVPINQLAKFLNFLNMNEGQAVIPFIPGVLHEKIEAEADKGFIKTYVPFSESAPHMALFDGKHYYKRSGDSFYQCEHYDIVDMLARKRSPDLHLTVRILRREQNHMGKYYYEIVVSIENKGKAMAKYPGLAINCNHHYRQYSHGLDGNSRTGLERVANNTLYRFNYSGGINTVIYPGTTLDVDKFMTEVQKNEMPQDFEITYVLSAENMETRGNKKVIETNVILAQSVLPV